jgi:hypothetical protein
MAQASAFVAIPLVPQVFDATADFSAASNTNPNGVWQYGYSSAATPGYSFTAFDTFASSASAASWSMAGNVVLGTPLFYKNTSGNTTNGVADGFIALHPGPDGGPDFGDAAILRFVAPSAGSWSYSGQLLVGDIGITLGALVVNGHAASAISLGDTTLNPSFSGTVVLAAGDTLDPVVGHGTDNFFYDSTPVRFTISSAVPEPAPAALWAAGQGALLVARRLRRRSSGPAR